MRLDLGGSGDGSDNREGNIIWAAGWLDGRVFEEDAAVCSCEFSPAANLENEQARLVLSLKGSWSQSGLA